MNLVKRQDGWWIEGVPPYDADGKIYTSCGPYPTRAEAESDARGLRRFYDRNQPPQKGGKRGATQQANP